MQGLLAALITLSIFPAQRDGSSNATAPPAIARFLERSERSRQGTIAELKFTIRGLRNTFPMSDETRRRIATLERNVAQLEANEVPFVAELAFPPQVGDIGRLPRLRWHVEQIFSDREMLVRCSFPVVVVATERFRSRYDTILRPMTFLVRGVSTNGYTEGAEAQEIGVFEVIGRYTYRTQSNRQISAPILAPFDLATLEPYRRRAAR